MSSRPGFWLIVIVVGVLLPLQQSSAEHALVRVYADTPQSAKLLASMQLDIASALPGSYIDVIVGPDELHRIALTGLRTEILTEDMESRLPPLSSERMDSYRTYAEMKDYLFEAKELHPDIVDVRKIGRTWENRDIWAAKISDHPGFDEISEPDVLLVGLHHAREIITPEVVLFLMEHLLNGYGLDPRITNLVNDREIWIVPMLNVDGHVYVEEGYTLWRKNRRPSTISDCVGVDVNRNYGYMWGFDEIGSSGNPCSETYRGIALFSEYETQAVRDLVLDEAHNFTMAVSYHSYGDLILYPWGYTAEPTPDARTYAALAESMSVLNGYTRGPAYSAIYPTNGDFDDWMYADVSVEPYVDPKNPPVAKKRTFSFTFEVGGGFWPPEELIYKLCNENLEPNLFLIAFADSPYRVWPPETPVMEDPVALANGGWELRWSTPQGAPCNKPVSYEIERCTGESAGFDGMESGLALWENTGFAVSDARSHSGSQSLYTGGQRNKHSYLTSAHTYTPAPGDSMAFWCLYGLPPDYRVFIEVSEDNGADFHLLEGVVTGSSGESKPVSGVLSGTSDGWSRAAFPLDDYVGKDIVYRLRCVAGGMEPEDGIYIDDLGPMLIPGKRSTVKTSATSERFMPIPSPDEPLTFRVRASDADGHSSRWSSGATIAAGGKVLQPVAVAPNPFSTVTRVYFAAPTGGSGFGPVPARLEIFDAAGRLVRTLFKGEISTDRFYEKAWDGLSGDGGMLPTGLYFVVLSVRDRKYADKAVFISGP